MRLLSLDLERYGPFTQKRLAFRPDARLHVVFGPNEAGKTSSLAAVTDLLFGVERRTPDDFLRPGKEMRLGATIRDRNGAEMSFWRRKLKPLLSDGANAALPDDALAPFLGGLSREIYRRAFGLDAEALRKSGDELKASDGELGAALFSAASGLRGVGEIKAAMEREADGIFAERRSQNRIFYQASDRYEAARKTLRESETRAGDLKAIREELASQEEHVGQADARRTALAVERSRLESLKRAAPILGAIDAAETRLSELGDLPAAPEGAGVTLVEAVAETMQARAALQEASRSEQDLREEQAGITLDQGLLDRAEAIERLQTELGAYRKGIDDLPGIEREEDGASRQLAEIARRLGLADVETLLAKRPDDASMARVAELVEAGQKLDQALQSRKAELDSQRALLAERRREQGRRSEVRDPAPLRQRLTALADLRRLSDSVHEHAAANAAEEAEIIREAARLLPAVADVAVLATSSLPSRETITAFAARLAALDEEARAERQRLQAAESEAADAMERLARLSAGAQLPTRERILAVREARDRHWQRARAALFGADLSPSQLAETVVAFETARAEADALADAVTHEAQRLAAHDEADRARKRAEANAQTHRARLAEMNEERDRAIEEWGGHWVATGLAPLSPAEMAPWLGAVSVLLGRHGRLLERRELERGLVAQIDAARPSLVALIAELGLPIMPGLSIAAELQRAEAEIDRMSRDWAAVRDAQTRLAELEERIAGAEEGVQALGVEHERWQQAFASAVPAIGLARTATIAEALASLAAWREVPPLIGERERLRRRISGIRRDATRFETEVTSLAADVLSRSVGAPDQRLRQIAQSLTRMRDAWTHSEAITRRIDEAHAKTRLASERAEKADRELAALAHGLGLPAEATLGNIGQALSARDALLEALRQRRGELANATDGRDEADLRAALREQDVDHIAAEIERIEEERRRLEIEGQEAYAAGKQARARLEALGGAVEAEVALQQRRNAETEMLEAAREWAVLSIGAAMIGTAVTRQRQSRQEPLMARAGAFFATLTGDAFSGLGQSFDEDDVPHLVGRRANDAELHVGAMSEGTRDQLYLALRLAYLEDFASRAEPPPFLADDLFASFDDARTANGLRALARIGETVQPILFTHHSFVVEAARQELGAAVDIVNLR
jgi:uncharacterized protein YhaN